MKKVIWLFAFVFTALFSKAQKGGYVSVFGFPQITNIKNSYDLNASANDTRLGSDFNLESTYNYGFGSFYYRVFSEYFGLKGGIIYSRQGQNYSSRLFNYGEDSIDLSYTSEVRLNYLKIPVLTHFTIKDENTTTYFTLQFGLQAGILTGGSYSITSGDASFTTVGEPKMTDLFNRVDLSYVVGGDLHIRLNEEENLFLILGVQFDKSIGGIENIGYAFEDDVPNEVLFPVGVPKTNRYSIPSTRANYSTKNESFSVRSGLLFKVHK